jgi:hypothetical protein
MEDSAVPVSLPLRVGFLVLLLCAACAPEALGLPRIYHGDFRPTLRARSPTSSVLAADVPAEGSAFYKPRRHDCEASWNVPVVIHESTTVRGGSSIEGPYCHTALQCTLHYLGMNYSHGFFIETGAFDGLSGSHTLMFERHLCWKGLLFEPSERFFGTLEMREGGIGGGPSARPHSLFLNAAVVDSAHDNKELYAGIDNEPTNSVPASEEAQAQIAGAKPNAKKIMGYSIAHQLRELGVGWRGVDFWSLDIESYEMQALNGLEEFRPTIMLIEVWEKTHGDNENKRHVHEKMKQLGYVEEALPDWYEKPNDIFGDALWRFHDA